MLFPLFYGGNYKSWPGVTILPGKESKFQVQFYGNLRPRVVAESRLCREIIEHYYL